MKISCESAIKNYGTDKEIIAFMHYPPIPSKELLGSEYLEFYKTMKQYNIQECYYGHLHGSAHKDAIEGNVGGINFHLISADYLDFNVLKV